MQNFSLTASRTGTPRQLSDSGLLMKTQELKNVNTVRRGSLPIPPSDLLGTYGGAIPSSN